MPDTGNSTPKSLDQFVAEVREKIETFESDWRANHAAEPDKYPLELPDWNTGLWYEFFMDHLYSGDS